MTILRWSPPEQFVRDQQIALQGPGGPFEVVEEEVLGVQHEVFAHRLPHLRALLAEGVARFGDRPYLIHADRTVSFAEAGQLVASTAETLREQHGIGPGDHVAIAAANRYEHVIAAWSVIVLGAVVVELNGWWTGPELSTVFASRNPSSSLATGHDWPGWRAA